MIFYVWSKGELTTFRTSDGCVLVAELTGIDHDNILARKTWPALYACADAPMEEEDVRAVINLVKEGRTGE